MPKPSAPILTPPLPHRAWWVEQWLLLRRAARELGRQRPAAAGRGHGVFHLVSRCRPSSSSWCSCWARCTRRGARGGCCSPSSARLSAPRPPAWSQQTVHNVGHASPQPSDYDAGLLVFAVCGHHAVHRYPALAQSVVARAAAAGSSARWRWPCASGCARRACCWPRRRSPCWPFRPMRCWAFSLMP